MNEGKVVQDARAAVARWRRTAGRFGQPSFCPCLLASVALLVATSCGLGVAVILMLAGASVIVAPLALRARHIVTAVDPSRERSGIEQSGASRPAIAVTSPVAALLCALVLVGSGVASPIGRADAAGVNGRGEATPELSGTAAGWLRLPDPRTRYAGDIRQASQRYGVSAALVEAVIRAESAFNPFAVSHRGARGLMQLMPGTAQALGVQDSFDPRENIDGGVRHLRNLIDRYPGDLPRVLAAYNAGAGAVDFYRGIPPFAETRQYVEKIIQHPGVTGRIAAAEESAEAPGALFDNTPSGSSGESSRATTRRLVVGPKQPLPVLPLIDEARKGARGGGTAVSVQAGAAADAPRESIAQALARMRERGVLGSSAKGSPAGAPSPR